jgi:pimeloyl-ACP methyl ester carboxylesterase
LGQGDHTIPSDDADVDASLPAQAQILLETLDEVMVTQEENSKNENDPVVVDIAGFSFGGRVAMATACVQNDRDHCENNNGIRIRRLHLTGVGCDRSDFGHLAMLSFPDVVRNDPSLRSFAWSILLATYSSGYLRSLPETTLERFLDHIASSNHPRGLLAILEQAEVKDMEDPWHVANMADRLTKLSRSQLNPNSSSSNNNNNNDKAVLLGKLCVGEMDTMAPVDEVERLREKSDWIQKEVDVLPDCGHAVVLEQPSKWRESVLSFLNDNNTDDGNGSI